MEQHFTQILLLLGIAVAIIVAFQRLHIPTNAQATRAVA
jgi:hypothetical protein